MSSAVHVRAGTPALVLGRLDGHCTDELKEKGLNLRDGSSQLAKNSPESLGTVLDVTVACSSTRSWNCRSEASF